MAKLEIYCGLLGAGKTTVISQILKTAYLDHRVAIIENEVGKVNLDAEELQQASVEMREITSGCVCCSLRGNFTEAMNQLVTQMNPEYIIVEPSGVANLQDVIDACTEAEGVVLNRVIMIIKANKYRALRTVVGDFFADQIKTAKNVYLNFTEEMSEEEIEEVQTDLWNENPDLVIIKAPVDQIDGNILPEPGQEEIASWEGHEHHNHEHDHHDHEHEHHDHEEEDATLHDCYAFQNPVDDQKMDTLFALLRSDRCGDIWRAKGYLKKDDGSITKVDYVYGDSYQGDSSPIAEDKLNLLVIIGQQINRSALEAELAKIDEAAAS